MQVPSGEFLIFDVVESTQDIARERIALGEFPSVVFAHHQSRGRGRFRREWHSQPGDSLTMSIVFHPYSGHAEPWLVGMAAAIGFAGAIHCRLQWPNDLVFKDKKVGGILTEIVAGPGGNQIPVVGLGLNLSHRQFPDKIADRATSMYLCNGRSPDPEPFARELLAALTHAPEPDSWGSIAQAWQLFDSTPGKPYRLPDGREAFALGVGPDGRLICSADGETQSVMAAEALFGPEWMGQPGTLAEK